MAVIHSLKLGSSIVLDSGVIVQQTVTCDKMCYLVMSSFPWNSIYQ